MSPQVMGQSLTAIGFFRMEDGETEAGRGSEGRDAVVGGRGKLKKGKAERGSWAPQLLFIYSIYCIFVDFINIHIIFNEQEFICSTW